MSSVRVVPFNAFPKVVRDRFVNIFQSGTSAPPVISVKSTYWWGIIGSLILFLGAGFVSLFLFFVDFDRPFSRDAVQPWGVAIGHVVALFLFLLSILLIFRIVLRRRALPFPAGRYLFPLDVVDARTETLRVTPIADMADYKIVHHYTNGVYSYSMLTLMFKDAPTETFQVRGEQVTMQAMERFFQLRERIREAAGRQDYQGVAAFDPFFEVRMNDSWATLKATPGGQFTDGPIAGRVPRIGWFTLAALFVALFAGPALLGIHNLIIDELRFGELKRIPTVSNCRTALRDGNRHKDEILKMLAPAALREAKQAKTVTAFRGVVKEFPNTPEAAEAKTLIHGAFVNSMARFRQLAASRDPKMMPFVEELVEYLERNDSPPIAVRFRRPKASYLEQADAYYAKKFTGKSFIPIAPNFEVKASDSREAIIRNELVKGFSKCFANDVLSFQAGEGLGDSETASADLKTPVIEIAYEVKPSESYYTLQSSDKTFVGIQINFAMRMRIPKQADDFTFALSVQPPEHFTVHYQKYGASDSGPGNALVYDQMATRAFDEFSDKLQDVFFKSSDSKPSKQTEDGTDGIPG